MQFRNWIPLLQFIAAISLLCVEPFLQMLPMLHVLKRSAHSDSGAVTAVAAFLKISVLLLKSNSRSLLSRKSILRLLRKMRTGLRCMILRHPMAYWSQRFLPKIMRATLILASRMRQFISAQYTEIWENSMVLEMSPDWKIDSTGNYSSLTALNWHLPTFHIFDFT